MNSKRYLIELTNVLVISYSYDSFLIEFVDFFEGFKTIFSKEFSWNVKFRVIINLSVFSRFFVETPTFQDTVLLNHKSREVKSLTQLRLSRVVAKGETVSITPQRFSRVMVKGNSSFDQRKVLYLNIVNLS